jgi:RimJ/RimL family protein N-acetyltransferase
VRVELETHALGEGSRAALLRIGAVDEGTLRPHMVAQRGCLRDSACFTIVETKWPAVRALLETGLAADPTA